MATERKELERYRLDRALVTHDIIAAFRPDPERNMPPREPRFIRRRYVGLKESPSGKR